MVLPLVDEDRPKCYMCHEGFESIDDLREHTRAAHGGAAHDDQKVGTQSRREPAPGDVAVF